MWVLFSFEEVCDGVFLDCGAEETVGEDVWSGECDELHGKY